MRRLPRSSRTSEKGCKRRLNSERNDWDGVTKCGELPVVSIAYQKRSGTQIAEIGMIAWQRD